MENRRQIDAQTVRLRKSVRRRTGGNEGPREGSFSELLSVHIKSWEGSRDVHLLEWGVRLFSSFTAGHHGGADCWHIFPGNPLTMPSLSSTSPIQISVCSINPF